MPINPVRNLFVALCLTLAGTCGVLAEPPQINIVGGDGNLSQTQTPSSATTDFTVSGHLVGETAQANILPGETWNVRFADPHDSFLLRVLDPSGTRLLGTLNVYYGSFVLVNTHGIDIGSLARVNLDHATFAASTLDIRNQDFVAGKYAFAASAGAGSRAVVNHGLIHTTGPSSVVLLGQALENAGVIEAPLSQVALASGDTVTLGLDAGGLIAVDVADPVREKVFDRNGVPQRTQISNTGTINADGGTVLINAKSLNGVFDRSVNLEGCIRATRAVQGPDGTVRIVASDAIVNTGTLEAGTLVEQGGSLHLGGTVQVGTASMDNADGAVVLGTGSYAGTYEDAGDIIVDNNAQLTLTGATILKADSDPGTHAHDGNGIFTMNSGSSILGGGNALTVYSSDRDASGVSAPSVLRDIFNVTALNLYSSPAAASLPAYTLLGMVDAGGSNVDIDGHLALEPGGTLAGAKDIFITGNWTNDGGTFTPGTGRVTFISILADQLINGTAPAQAFYDVRVAKGTKTLSVGGSTTTLSMHDLALESGVFATGTAATVNVAGNVVFGSTAVTGFNGLTLDADTFVAGDAANIIGDTARTYYPVTDAVLDALIAGKKVKTLIIGVPYDQNGYSWLGTYWGGSVPVGTDRVNMVDNNYIAYIAHVKDRISTAGSAMTLIVEFGNEYNYHPEWFGGNINNWFSALSTAASAVHAAFGSSIKVSTASGDIIADFVATIQTGVDMVGLNTYRGLGATSTLVSQWKAACATAGIQMPLYLSETGFPSWSGDGGEVQQNLNVSLLWSELEKNDLGVTFMSFEDNMRKGGLLAVQDAREDYWGWLREDGTSKAVYDTMAGAWAAPQFQAGSAHVNVGGDWINNGGTFTPGTSTVTFNAADGGHVITAGPSAFAHVVFDDGGAGGSWTVATDPLAVNSDLALTHGHVTLGQKLTVQGDLDIVNGTLDAVGHAIDLAGNWRSTGAFIHGNNTVTLTGGDQSVAGNNTFYNLTKTDGDGATLTFQAGTLQAIEGALTLTGSPQLRLRLRSDVSGEQWSVHAASVRMRWLDVMDSRNTGPKITLLDSFDAGDNTGYTFGTGLNVPPRAIYRLEPLDIRGLTGNFALSFEARCAAQWLGSTLIQGDGLLPLGAVPR